MIERNFEACFRPGAERCDLGGDADETKIQLAISHRRVAGITFRPKFQDNPVAEIRRERPMGLERDALFRAARAQSAETRDGRVPAIGGYEGPGAKGLLAGRDLPMIRARIRRRKRGDCYRFRNRRTEFAGAVEEQLVEQASLHCDFSIVAHGKLDRHASSADSDELDTIQLSVRQTPNALRQLQPP